MTRNRELELKYDVTDRDAVAGWLDAHFPAADADADAWQTTSVTDRYFDTADHSLARAGYGARLRRSDGQTTLTLKAEGTVRGARHERTEIEGPAGPGLDLDRWPPSPARELLLRLAGETPLADRFTIRQRRRERTIEQAQGSVLVSLDEARVSADRRQVARLVGLEVELCDGRRRALRALERALGESGLVAAQPLSKVQLAHAAVAARAPLEPADLFAEAGRKVLARHLARMLEREQAARASDELALKQMRVATRRMRATWRVFDGAYRRSDQRRYLAELRAVARRLGEVRDLDVLLARLPADPALEPLAAAWRLERATAMARLLEHLDSAAYRRFVADYRAFVGTPGAATAGRLSSVRVADLAGERVAGAHARLSAFGSPIGAADEATLHALRIVGKRLRYTLETFRDLAPEVVVGRLVQRLVALQDALGALNDSAVAATRAQAWLAGNGGSGSGSQAQAGTRAAVEAYLAAERGEIAAHRRALGRPWRSVAGVTFDRDIARVVASLGRGRPAS